MILFKKNSSSFDDEYHIIGYYVSLKVEKISAILIAITADKFDYGECNIIDALSVGILKIVQKNGCFV